MNLLNSNTNIPYQREYRTSSTPREISVSSCGEEMHRTLENWLGKNLNGNNKYKSIKIKFQGVFLSLCATILSFM